MRRAQSTLEFAIVIFAIVAALLAMQVYIRRGLQGKLRASADEFSVQQYAPGKMSSDTTMTQQSDITTTSVTAEDDERYTTTTTTYINSQSDRRLGTEKITPGD
ncbi:MAG: hypothetical protein KA022_00670 [Candidatus Omnitrophica bacterium]|jgi:5-deoxy-D-glucuronate isomerase|nr:hypothetical protein [Candidatus Omnitrophota bacterium]